MWPYTGCAKEHGVRRREVKSREENGVKYGQNGGDISRTYMDGGGES